MSTQITLFDLFKDFASRRAGGGGLNVYHLLYGYTQLLSMDSKLLDQLLPDEKDRADMEKIRHLAGQHKLNVKIMQRFLSLTLNAPLEKDLQDSHLKPVVSPVLEEVAAGRPVDLVSFFSNVLDSGADMLPLFKDNVTFDDLLAYKNAGSEGTAQKADTGKKKTKAAAEKASGTKKTQPVKKTESGSETAEQQEHEAQLSDKWVLFNELALKTERMVVHLKHKIMGQDEAVQAFAEGIFKAGLVSGASSRRPTPAGTFLFAGPSGVGKTMLAELGSEYLDLPHMRFNMTDYATPSAIDDLTGLSKKFTKAAPGQLTGFVAENPVSIIILDEIEKAPAAVLQLFLQVLDAGVLRDAYVEKDIDFTGTILIFTTNAGQALYDDNPDAHLSSIDRTVVLDALSQEVNAYGKPVIPPALLSRFAAGSVIMFNRLTCHNLIEIAEKQFDWCTRFIQEKYGFTVNYDPLVPHVFLFSQSANNDARIINAQSGSFLMDELYELGRQTADMGSLITLKSLDFKVTVPEDDPEIASLFRNQRKNAVLFLCDEEVAEMIRQDMPADSRIEIISVQTCEDALRIINEEDILLAIIDPMYGYSAGLARGLAIDDLSTEGIRCFNTLRTTMSYMPVYIMEQAKKLGAVDVLTLQQMGSRGVFRYEEGKVDERLANYVEVLYSQEQINMLTRKEQVLHFHTAQHLSEDGTKAEIEFYGFSLHRAIKADTRGSVLSDSEMPNVTFDDVIGAKNAKEELKYFIEYLKHPKEFMLKGTRPPKGILLYGPPGTGKTMLARAMAGEAGVAFLPTTAAAFKAKYVGESEANIRELFATAKRYAPAVIFIDEIDAIGKTRTGSEYTHTSESMLNTLLTEMDGFAVDPRRPVFVLAATNYPIDESPADGKTPLDPALIRRFDNRIYVDLPDEDERKLYLNRELGKLKNNEVTQQAIDNIAARSTGVSLALLQNIIALAVRSAGRAGTAVTDEGLLTAFEEYKYGEEREWGREFYEGVAYHESGHAYVTFMSGEKPSYMTIVSRGPYLGYMQHENKEKVANYTRQDLLWRIRISLAGRASEIVFFGEEKGTNTGVSADLRNATNQALRMICSYGMTEGSLLSLEPSQILGTPMGDRVLAAADKMLHEEMENTIQMIREGKDKVTRLASALLEKNQLTGDEIEEILSED